MQSNQSMFASKSIGRNHLWMIGAGAAFSVMLAGGCATSYSVPGAAADFSAMGLTPQQVRAKTDVSIAERLERMPLASFPASVAVVRVQGPGYRSQTAHGWGEGNFTVVTTRDVETDADFARLTALPMLEGIAPLNRIVLPGRLNNEKDLREAAATVQADLVLVYTFDTMFGTERKVAPLGLITLGLFPDREARVTSTASAVLIDTRNAYVYGLAEATGEDNRITNAWTNRSAIDASRRKAEREAFDGLMGELETMWRGVVARHVPGQTTETTAAASPSM